MLYQRWMIDDKATSIFVDNFHSNNSINNKSYKYAPHLLNKAKLEFIRNHEDYKIRISGQDLLAMDCR